MTNNHAYGRALVKPVLGAPGSFAATALRRHSRGRSRFLRLGSVPATTAGASRTTPAR